MDSCFLFIGMAADALVGLSGAFMIEAPTKSDKPLLKTAEGDCVAEGERKEVLNLFILNLRYNNNRPTN